MDTVGNTGQGAGFLGTTGAGYRHVADLGASPPGLASPAPPLLRP